MISVAKNFFLPIGPDAFEHIIDGSERQRLRKGRRAGFQFHRWCNSDVDIDAVTAFLVDTRRQQGYALSLSTDRLRDLLLNFPDEFPVFTLTAQAALIALVVCVRVRDDILYTFLPASDPRYRAYSPMVMLMEGVFDFCRQQQIQLLDLGVALDHNQQPKPGLMRFKQNLGAQESVKMVFGKVF